MAKQINKEALGFVKNHGEIYGDLAKALNINPGSISVFIHRNSRRLTEFAAITVIANAMRKNPNEIVSEAKVNKSKKLQKVFA